MFPIFRPINIDEKSKEMKRAVDRMGRISNEIVAAAKKRIGLEEKNSIRLEDKIKIGHSKDILSVLMRANAGLGEDTRSLTDTEMTHQICTLLLAGHETTANTTAWALQSLATHPKVQKLLRNEILSHNFDSPTMEQLNSLPYLDKVARESLRLHPVVSYLERVLVEDDVIPVDTSYKDLYGQTRNSIIVSKGDTIQIPIVTINHSKEIWGEDAKEFNPDRWDSPPEGSYSIPGVWGKLFTFGGGVRGCIGFKFALIEMKALLYTLIKDLEFEPAVQMEEFDNSVQLIKKPILKSDPRREQLPIIIRLAPTEIVHVED